MNHHNAQLITDSICYLSPRGHYYVAEAGLDMGYARHAQLINRYHHAPIKAGQPSQFELAKRANRS